MENEPYVQCLSHSVVLGLLSGEALVGCVASFPQPCLLLKALDALLSLLCNTREHKFTRKCHHEQAQQRQLQQLNANFISPFTRCNKLRQKDEAGEIFRLDNYPEAQMSSDLSQITR